MRIRPSRYDQLSVLLELPSAPIQGPAAGGGDWHEGVAGVCGLLRPGGLHLARGGYARLIAQGDWYTARVVGHHQELKCPQGNCGLLVKYTDLEYVDENDRTHKLSFDKEYDTATVRIFADPSQSTAVPSLRLGFTIIFLWLVYAAIYVLFIGAIVRGRLGGMEFG